jgi:PGF-pre-PGF domain-containing protein
MRLDIKKNQLTKNGLIRKLLITFFMTLMLMATISSILISSVNAADVNDICNTSDTVTKTIDSSTTDSSNIDTSSCNTGDTSNIDTKTIDSSTTDSSNIDTSSCNAADIDSESLSKENELNKLENTTSNEELVRIEEIESMTENKLGDLITDKEKEVPLENSSDIDSIEFTPATNLEDVKVTVIKLKDKPEKIAEPAEKNISVYRYLDIKLTSVDEYVHEDNIKSLKFKIKVEQIWITDNNIDEGTILLMRYHDGEWQSLTTVFLSNDDTYLYYEAESPGCSTFAVVGSKVVENGEVFEANEPEIPWTFIIGFIIAAIVILLIFLFKARYIYLEESTE